MKIAIVLLGAGLLAGLAFLLIQERRPQAAPGASAPAAQPAAPSPAPVSPAPILPQKTAPAPAPLPPGVKVATPGGDPDAPIKALPPDQTVVRDHRGKPPEGLLPIRAITTQGVDAAVQALRDAVLGCKTNRPGVTLRATITTSGGRAHAENPQLIEAGADPELQACVEKALSSLTWSTPDPDGSDPMFIPLKLK